jgi:catechol 2,3-dioxygenase-like lactoylglutathione lyase family enzyme
MPPAVYRTGHVGLNVSDLARAKAFYREVFGLDVLGESVDPARGWAFLGRGSDVVLTLWGQSTGSFVTDRPGLHHLSFQVESVEQVQETERRVRKLGARIHHGGVVPHAEGRDSGGIFFEDPDGIRLEVFAPSGVGSLAGAPHGAAPTCGFF